MLSGMRESLENMLSESRTLHKGRSEFLPYFRQFFTDFSGNL